MSLTSNNNRKLLLAVIDPLLITPLSVRARVTVYANDLFDFFSRVNFIVWFFLYSLTLLLNDANKANYLEWRQLRYFTLSGIMILFLLYHKTQKTSSTLRRFFVVCLGLLLCLSYSWSHKLGAPLPREYITIIPFLIFATSFRSYLLSSTSLLFTILISFTQWRYFAHPAWVFTDLEISCFLLFFSSLIHMGMIENKVNFYLFSDSIKNQKFFDDRAIHFASNLAHDIRSPLAALNALEPEFQSLPESTRQMARMAVARIRDISNNLLRPDDVAHPLHATPVAKSVATFTPVVLSTLIDPILSEKRLKLGKASQIELQFQVNSENYALSARISPVEFKRVLSNLLDNAIESIARAGVVNLTLTLSDSNARIIIKDTGKGISPELLPTLGNRGTTHGKDQGTGLGIAIAKEYITEWNGSLSIESEPLVGTTVQLAIPLAPAPDWYATEVIIYPHTQWIIVDDEPSVHQVWRNLIAKLSPHRAPKLVHLDHWASLNDFVKGIKIDDSQKRHFFIDHEFAKHSETGLLAIEKLRICASSTLVTSHFENPTICTQCARLGIRIIPKTLLAFIPIRFAS